MARARRIRGRFRRECRPARGRPTSALDPETTGEVLGVIADLAKTGMTMVVVTHEMAFARQVSNRVALIESCKVDSEADPETFFRDQPSPGLKAFLATIHRTGGRQRLPPACLTPAA